MRLSLNGCLAGFAPEPRGASNGGGGGNGLFGLAGGDRGDVVEGETDAEGDDGEAEVCNVGNEEKYVSHDAMQGRQLQLGSESI